MERLPPSTKADWWLLYGFLAYAAANFVAVALASLGVIHPPWGVLIFFSVFGPAGACLSVVFIWVIVDRFDWAVLVGFIVGILVLAAASSFYCFMWKAVAVTLGWEIGAGAVAAV